MQLTISRVVEIAKLLTTKAGQELTDFLQYMSGFCEQVLRALRNGITFKDNVDCLISTVSLTHATAQVINTGVKQPMGIIPLRVISTEFSIDTLTWYIDGDGQVNVKVTFLTTPTTQLNVV